MFSHGIFAAEDDAVVVVDYAVTDGVGKGHIADLLVPSSYVKLLAEND